ncbi:MAG TPA: alkaline phosphatase family protein [Thermoanaerobaculia bacterium]
MLVSFDGLSANELEQRRDLPAFARLERDGLFVQRVTPVTPSVTSSAHVAILTGTTPDVNGIVANRFHVPGTPWTQSADGFDADVDAETLLEAAHRAGKRVGSIAFPTIDGRNARRTADFGLLYTDPAVPSRMLHLHAADFHVVERPPHHPSFSPVMRAHIQWAVPNRAHRDVRLFAYDTTDDHVRNYNTFLVESNGGEIVPDSHGWFAISSRTPDALYGSWSKLMHTTSTLDEVVVYAGEISRTNGYPDSFRQLVDTEVGFWPGAPDEHSAQQRLEGGDGVDGETFAEQNARFSDFFAGAAAVAIRRMQFDLLLAYNPSVDKAAHQFLIVNASQPHATPENRAIAQIVRDRAFASADRAAQMIASALDPARDSLVVTGDHGLAPIDTELHLKAWLANHGFAQWVAFATGGNVAHLYRTGAPQPEETSRLIAELKATGLIERIDEKTPVSHPNSGDLVLYAYPHAGLRAANGVDIAPPGSYGQHGGIGSHHEFQTVLIAWGAGVKPGTISAMRQTQIAAFVSSLLGIDPPTKAERGP